MKNLSTNTKKNLFGFLTVVMFIIAGLYKFLPGIMSLEIIGTISAVLCFVFLLFWVKELKINNSQKGDSTTVLKTEKCVENEEAMLIIYELQTLIKKETGHGIKFVFEIEDTGMINLSVPRGFTFELRDNDKNPTTKKFQGRDFVEVINSFLEYFKEGSEGKITADENNFQFLVQFHYDNAWVVNNSHVGHYAYTDSFDE